MKKVVLKLEFYEDKVKKKDMRKVSGVSGVESIAIDMKEKKITVCGEMDPVKVASRLRKVCPTDMISVGPVKDPDKKKEVLPPPPLPPPSTKKDEPKKDSIHQKEEPKKKSSAAGGEGPGGDEKKKEIKVKDPIAAVPAPAPVAAAAPVPPSQHGQLVKAFAGVPPPYHHPYPPPPPPLPFHHYCQYPPPLLAPAYYVRSMEDNPSSCVIF